MASDNERWDGFIKQNPKLKINVQEKYLFENREIVSSEYLQNLWGISSKSIRNYVQQGMPVSKLSSSRFKVFDLIDCISWRMTSIDMGKSNVSKVQQKESSKEEVEEAVFQANRRKIIADAKKAEHEANVSEMKEKQMSGELISVEDIDKAMAEQAVLHKTDIINSEKILPTILENLTKGDIANYLRDHNQQRLDNLNLLIKKEFDCDETLYEVVAEVIENLKTKEPDEIINKLRSVR